MREQRVVIPYKPRAQFLPLHDRTQRWATVVAHRRAGKTVACVNDLLLRALQNDRSQPPPRYAYLAPTYGQAKDVAWSYLKRFAAPIPGVETREVDLSVMLPTGASIRLYGADNYDRLRGLYLDGIVIDEPADIDPRAWSEVVRPALADQRGWAVFIGTPKGRDYFYRLHKRLTETLAPIGDDAEWLSLTLRASETQLLPEGELEDARRVMTPDQYAQEFECSFDASILGAFYGADLAAADAEGRIGNVPVERDKLVHTAWDLGFQDSTAIWFVQQVGRELHLIDFYEGHHESLDHYAKVLRDRGYLYGEHYLPHDVQHHELSTGKSRLDTLHSLGIKAQVVPPHQVADGINAVRVLFPRMWFDAKRCTRGIEALRAYRREFDDKIATYKPKPRHDWTSHAADALRYFAAGFKDSPIKGRPIDRYRDAEEAVSYGWMGA